MQTILGIDRIQEYDHLFKGKRIALITNYSGVNSAWEENIDLFVKNGYHIVKLFTPEHGLYGCAEGKTIDNDVYKKYGIPMISLYGEKLKPTLEDLSDVDAMVYDIQDVGLRYYTYIYTMTYSMEAAAEKGIPFIVLDRPNPLGNELILGGCIKENCTSFVGDYGLPIRYGLTCGELGYYFIDYKKLDLDYTVVILKNYQRNMYFPQTGHIWNVPSPAIPSFQSAICYSGGCFFEATNISEGRGSFKPFQMYGAPYIDMEKLYNELKNEIKDDKVAFRKRAFIPFSNKFANQVCYGIEFEPVDQTLDFIPIALLMIRKIHDMFPEHYGYRKEESLERLGGDGLVRKYINGKIHLEEILNTWNEEAYQFKTKIESYRLY